MQVFHLEISLESVRCLAKHAINHSNIVFLANIAVSLLSPPYSLAPALASLHFLSPSTDLKLKHGILGLLKHLAQFAKLSPIIPKSLGEVNIIQKLSSSGIWDQETDAIANIIQLNAIGVAKHLCNSNRVFFHYLGSYWI